MKRRTSRRWMAISAATLLLSFAASLRAQGDKRDSQLRTVHGTVVDRAENPAPGSIIYLKNVKTLTVVTHIADDEGKYRFSGLDPNVDYEIHAEKENMMSAKRTISSFDNRKDITLPLKLDKKKNK
jgi:Carboxypeptidase regulatory-like domain